MREFDLVSGLNFLLETLYHDAKETKNKILFEYDPSYPRAFRLEAENTLKTLEYGVKSILYSIKDTKIKITFKLTNYNADKIFFRVFIKADKEITKLNETYASTLKNFIKNTNFNIIFNKDEILIDINMPLGVKRVENNMNLKSDSIKKYHALVAYDDEDGFKILSNQLKFIGIDVKPKHDYANLKNHLLDAIYRPNILFIHRKFIDNKEEFKQILKYKNLKHFNIVAICDEYDKFDDEIKQHITILRQPYTYDTICAILNTIYTNKQKAKTGE